MGIFSFFKIKTITYSESVIQMGSNIHRMYLPENVDVSIMYNETIILHNILKHYYEVETQIADAVQKGYDNKVSFFAKELLCNWSAISIPNNIEEFVELFDSRRYSGDSAKRWYDMLSYVYSSVDIRVIDVYIGRFYKYLIECYKNSSEDLTEEDRINILHVYEIYPWIWIIPQYQQANRESALDLPSNMQGNTLMPNNVLV